MDLKLIEINSSKKKISGFDSHSDTSSKPVCFTDPLVHSV